MGIIMAVPLLDGKELISTAVTILLVFGRSPVLTEFIVDFLISLHHRVQTCSGAHPASYPMGTRCSFPGSKAAGA
jgi:hypothetical protein